MYCSNCGSQATGNFCWKCGAPLNEVDSIKPPLPRRPQKLPTSGAEPPIAAGTSNSETSHLDSLMSYTRDGVDPIFSNEKTILPEDSTSNIGSQASQPIPMIGRKAELQMSAFTWPGPTGAAYQLQQPALGQQFTLPFAQEAYAPSIASPTVSSGAGGTAPALTNPLILPTPQAQFHPTLNVPPDYDWSQEINYNILVSIPTVRAMLLSAARTRQSANIKEEEWMEMLPHEFGVATKLGRKMTSKIGLRVQKTRTETVLKPCGKVLVALLCYILGSRLELAEVQQETGAVTLICKIASDWKGGEGVMHVKVERLGWYSKVSGDAEIPGMVYDTGKTKKILEKVFDVVHQAV